eukprot:12110-Prymnesium_polylepis.1
MLYCLLLDCVLVCHHGHTTRPQWPRAQRRHGGRSSAAQQARGLYGAYGGACHMPVRAHTVTH